MKKEHNYTATINWTGNKGSGTSNYRSYERSHTISIDGKPDILGSSDPSFRGDPGRYNPEELLIASLSSCHMLWYLHLCSTFKIVVVEYIDHARGKMLETPSGSGQFVEVQLNPNVIVKDESMITKAMALHAKAHELCFIANSVNFPVLHNAKCRATI